MAKIILFGGSFDPIHHGHFLMADQARLQIEAKQVIFIPAKNPRWKLPKLNGEHRFQMLKRYLNAYDWADVSRYELDGDEEVNYSIDTIKYFKKTHPNDELFWLLGADQVTKFHEWKNPELIASLVQLLVYARPKSSINQATISRYHMHVITGPESNASSSAIRECQSLDTSLSVLDYIQDNYLYYVDRLGRYLDELRRNHSFEVAKLAYQIAVSNQMNGAQAYLAGLLHDIGKNVLPPLREKIMEEHYPHYLSLSKVNYHQFIGEFLAQEDFKIVDEEVLKAIRQHGNVTIIPDLDQTKWFDYGKAYFKNNNASIDNDALKELIERVNGDLNAFINEANKLILYKNRINLIDVTLMIAKPLENNIFALTKALFRGDKASALDIFADLRTNNVEPITLVSMLANQFRLMSQIRYLDQRGLSQASIAKELGLPDFRIRMSLQDSRRLSRRAIINNLDTLYQLDLNIKSGLIDRYYAFELFILNFA